MIWVTLPPRRRRGALDSCAQSSVDLPASAQNPLQFPPSTAVCATLVRSGNGGLAWFEDGRHPEAAARGSLASRHSEKRGARRGASKNGWRPHHEQRGPRRTVRHRMVAIARRAVLLVIPLMG